MLLTKNCNKKYNIKVSKSIKLATLEHYRKIENPELQDDGEGIYNFNICITDPVWIEKKWFNTLMTGIARIGDESETAPVTFPGLTSASVDFQLFEQSPTHVLASTNSMSIERVAPESLIFCMSTARKTTDCTDLFNGYDDRWHLRIASADKFSKMIAHKLLAHAQSIGPENLFKETVQLDKLFIIASHGPVLYADRELEIDLKSNLDINQLLEKMDLLSNIKPHRYSKENEYRFTFCYAYENRILDIKRDTVIIDADQSMLDLTFS